MPGRTSLEREALAKQNAAIMAVFERAGFDHIAPDIIQPADIFLDRSGEDIRARTFVFSDPDGNELCLRPDLTVPACRYHLSHAATAEARYCYLGQAFRFPDEKLSPQEFTQAGIEWFGGAKPIDEEARILKLAISALEATGLTRMKVTTGDLGLFNALLADMPMPARWRQKLQHQFWRPDAFRSLLQQFSGADRSKLTSASIHVDAIQKNPDGVSVVTAALAVKKIPHVGDRALEDIAARLSEKFLDRSEQPLDATMTQTIETYLALEGPMTDMPDQLRKLHIGATFTAAIGAFEQRIAALEDLGLNPRRFHFDANFGRELEYYTGFVFQIEASAGNEPVAVAGGGRYDNLLADLGAPITIPAVGCAVHTERVKAALT
jgi:ATP phosphoribosyltransferase regulatory subunit